MAVMATDFDDSNPSGNDNEDRLYWQLDSGTIVAAGVSTELHSQVASSTEVARQPMVLNTSTCRARSLSSSHPMACTRSSRIRGRPGVAKEMSMLDEIRVRRVANEAHYVRR